MNSYFSTLRINGAHCVSKTPKEIYYSHIFPNVKRSIMIQILIYDEYEIWNQSRRKITSTKDDIEQ